MTRLEYAALLIHWFGYDFASNMEQLKGYEEELRILKSQI